MGNTFFLRLQTIPAIAAYLRQLEDAYEHQKNRNKVFRLMFDVAEFWLLLAKFAISPICAKFEAKVFNFDDFACKCLDHVQHVGPPFGSPFVQLPQLSCQCLLSRVQSLRSLGFNFPLALPGTVSLSPNLVNRQSLLETWRRFAEIGNHGNIPIITVPKKFVVSAYSHVVAYLCVPESPWLGSISNFVHCLPKSFNQGPYKDLVRIFPWLQKTDIVVGYVPIHPDDMNRMWQNRLCLRRSGTCRPQATR